MNGAAVPIEVLGSMRKRLILAGLLLLAAVSAYAINGVYQEGGRPDDECHRRFQRERRQGPAALRRAVAPKAASPQSWLVGPDDAENHAAGPVA